MARSSRIFSTPPILSRYSSKSFSAVDVVLVERLGAFHRLDRVEVHLEEVLVEPVLAGHVAGMAAVGHLDDRVDAPVGDGVAWGLARISSWGISRSHGDDELLDALAR